MFATAHGQRNVFTVESCLIVLVRLPPASHLSLLSLTKIPASA